MKTPNLFIVGFQKCGSSSLFDLLNQHSEIQGAATKETFALSDKTYEHYKLDNSPDNKEFSWAQYFNFSDGSTYFMEGSVCNFYQETALSYISKIPDAKVIFIIRNPLNRFISTFTYYGASGVNLEPSTTIEDYYDLVKNQALLKSGMKHALEHGRYSTFIQRWEEAVGKDKVLVVSLEQLTKNEKATLAKIGDFLNIQGLDLLSIGHKNKSVAFRYKKLNRFLVKAFGGMNLRNTWLGKLYQRLAITQNKRVIVSKELEHKLKDYYIDEYEKFNCFFNI